MNKPAPTNARSTYDLTPPSLSERKALEAGISQEEADVLLRHGTEAPFCGGLLDNKEDGVYCCRLCGLPLFRAKTKFESGTGWPSFFAPLNGAVDTTEDRSHFMTRTEVRCANCGGHLGHLFPDGPRPTGLRYCMNGVAMKFEPEKS